MQWQENDDKVIIDEIIYYVARIEGMHYLIKEENKFSRGKSEIIFIQGKNKGKIISASYLWSQGVIPERYKNILTDNAIFNWK